MKNPEHSAAECPYPNAIDCPRHGDGDRTYVLKLPKPPTHRRDRSGQVARILDRPFRCALEIRHDPQTERWTVVLVSRTTKEDVVVAWKQTEEDAAEWARNYGVRP